MICVATLLIVAGLALGTRSETPTAPAHSPFAPAKDNAGAANGQVLDTRDARHTQTPREHNMQDSRTASNLDTVETATDTLAAAATNVETSRAGAYTAMPWVERDEREVAEEIARSAERADGSRALPSPSFADMQRLHELVPELAEDTANGTVDLAGLADDPGLGVPSPGTTPRSGTYFEPEEDERD